MSCLYVVEQGSKILFDNNQFVVEQVDGSKKFLPGEILESIMIFGNVHMTISVFQRCLRKGIRVSFLSSKGHYFGRLESTSFTNPMRIKKQVYLSDSNEQTLLFSKLILKSKIHNQEVILRRYSRNSHYDCSKYLRDMKIYENKIDIAKSIQELMGYEGIAARSYFEALSNMVEDEFKFKGRTKRPPKDAFNSMLSLGYTILFYEIYAELENRGIDPYISFTHRIKERHPALVSDLLEEWRAVLIDATVMSLVQGHEISIEEFYCDESEGGVLISDRGLKILIRKIEKKMRSTINYLEYLDSPISFRRCIWWQVKTLAKCIDEEDLSLYQPLKIR